MIPKLTGKLSKAIFISLALLCTSVAQAQLFAEKTRQLLPEQEAFQVVSSVDENGLLRVSWSVADDYYIYRDQFAIESATPGVAIGDIAYPQGTIEDDPEFGEVEVYFYNVELTAPLLSENKVEKVDLILKGQGCNKPVGVCYPPMTRTASVDLSKAMLVSSGESTSPNGNTPTANKSFMAYVVSAFFAGILLSFTPCVLPMIPILAGIIAGQQNPSRLRSGWLALCYVAGTIVTYIIAGVLAGATGAQLQAYFQNIWVILAICLLLFALAASLFGWFKIQLPSAIQSKLNATSSNSKSASISSFSLGLVSALVVGACVSPVLIITLGAAITQGDPILGGAIMGAMALGMGLLLILFGFGAGWILPRTGPWMEQIQIVFGFMVLGVAVYLLSTLSIMPSLYLWAALFMCSAFYLGHLSKSIASIIPKSLIQALSAGLLIWGAMALVGGSLKGEDILNPLEYLGSSNSQAKSRLPFTTTTQLAEAQALLQNAKLAGKPVMIDFYADWCLDCKRMHRTTFKSEQVQNALADWALIEIDVTKTSEASEQVKRHFSVFGPPATLFIKSDGTERTDLRQYGYIKETDFLDLVNAVN